MVRRSKQPECLEVESGILFGVLSFKVTGIEFSGLVKGPDQRRGVTNAGVGAVAERWSIITLR